MIAPGGDQTTECTLRTTIWRSEGAQRVRVTPLQFIPITEHQPLPPSGTDGPALRSKPPGAGFNSEVTA